jgi:hypothetical protein
MPWVHLGRMRRWIGSAIILKVTLHSDYNAFSVSNILLHLLNRVHTLDLSTFASGRR